MDIAYGTKVYDYKRQSIGILIKTYNLGYVDSPDATGAKVVDTNGKLYATNLDNLMPIAEIKQARLYADLKEKDFKALNIPESFLND